MKSGFELGDTITLKVVSKEEWLSVNLTDCKVDREEQTE